MSDWEQNIRRTLLYFDLWQHPLSERELYAFFPGRCASYAEFRNSLRTLGPGKSVCEHEGYYFLDHHDRGIVARRKRNEERAHMMWRMARISMHLIKLFPFVRGVFVSGDLSKQVSTPSSDVDFFILTAPDRLWIARAFLILFKKVFLLNSKKFFCLNTFATTSHLTIDERNIYMAVEVATVKPLYNSSAFREFLLANDWIFGYFPNFDVSLLSLPACSERPGAIQKLFEWPFRWLPSDAIDTHLMDVMKRVWARRYAVRDAQTRQKSFLSTKNASRAYPEDVQDKILALYAERMRAFSDSSSSEEVSVSV